MLLRWSVEEAGPAFVDAGLITEHQLAQRLAEMQTALSQYIVAVKESVVHVGVRPAAGFASLSDETYVPLEAKPGLMNVTKFMSRPPDVVSAAQVEPLVVDVTNWPLVYGFEFEKPVVAQLHVKATVPCANAALSRKTKA